MSQSSNNFTSHFEEVSQIPDYFDSQTYPKNLQGSSILCSLRQLNERYQSHHHHNQLPTDQFVMNRPDVSPTSRHVLADATTNGLNLLRYNSNSNRGLVPGAESSATNNSRRENVEQEHSQSRRDYRRVIRPTPYKTYDPRYADIGLPVDPLLRAFKRNPHYSLPKATSDGSSTSNNITIIEYQCCINHLLIQEPTQYKPYDPRYADIGLPVDPYMRAFKKNPIFGIAALAKRDE